MRSGQQIVEALDAASQGVEKANRELARLKLNFYEADLDPQTGEVKKLGVGLRFDSAIREELAGIYERAIANGERPPAEDIRQAMADKAVQTKHPDLWAEFHNTKARIESLKSWLTNQRAAISADQSLRREHGEGL